MEKVHNILRPESILTKPNMLNISPIFNHIMSDLNWAFKDKDQTLCIF